MSDVLAILAMGVAGAALLFAVFAWHIACQVERRYLTQQPKPTWEWSMTFDGPHPTDEVIRELRRMGRQS